MTGPVPPIPASCTGRPVTGGLVAPFVNVRLADGGVDFRTQHNANYQRCWRERLCQVCGKPYGHLAVFFGGPRQVAAGRFDEPPLCPPCAVYASQACPMLAGRQPFYADRQRLVDGRRGHDCGTRDCDCAGWAVTDPDAGDAAGEPAHPWYAVYARTGSWQLTGKQVTAPCTDLGCLHTRTLVSGAQFIMGMAPRKTVLVSAPGRGRVWQRAEEGTACPVSAS